MDISKVYNDPVIFRKRKGEYPSPFKQISESLIVENNYALLTEVPNRADKVKVSGYSKPLYEVANGIVSEQTFKVDYTNGIVYFHKNLNKLTLKFEYLGEGVFLFPDSRLFLTDDKKFNNARDKFSDIDRGIIEQKNRVDELIRSTPQPSEVVDLRIDYNGNIFDTVRDRVNSEQMKIEEAYFDANGYKYSSLKERIDSIQLEIEGSYTSFDGTKLFDDLNIRLDYDFNLLNTKQKEIENRIGSLEDEDRINDIGFNEDGTFNMEYLKGVLSENQIESAYKWNNYGTWIDQNGVYSGLIVGNQIVGGSLISGNGTTEFNLNSGELSMANTEFSLGGNARIRFTDRSNHLYYTNMGVYGGMMFDQSLNGEGRPLMAIGVSDGSLDVNHSSFNGIRIHSGWVENNVSGVMTNIISNQLWLSSNPQYSEAGGWVFENTWPETRNRALYGMNGDQYSYDLGYAGNGEFTNAYIQNIVNVRKIEGWNDILFRNRYGNSQAGWTMKLAYEDNPTIDFYPINTGTPLYYNIGRSNNRINKAFINVIDTNLIGSEDKHVNMIWGETIAYKTLNQYSLREYKEDIKDFNIQDAIDYVLNTDIKTYYYKDKKDHSLYDLKVGIIYDEIATSKDYLAKSSPLTIDQSNIIFMNQAVTKHNYSEIERLKLRIASLESKLAKLQA